MTARRLSKGRQSARQEFGFARRRARFFFLLTLHFRRRAAATRHPLPPHMRRAAMRLLNLPGRQVGGPPACRVRCASSSSALTKTSPAAPAPASVSPSTSSSSDWRTAFGGQDRIGTDGQLVGDDDDGPTHRLTTPGGGLVSKKRREFFEVGAESSACGAPGQPHRSIQGRPRPTVPRPLPLFSCSSAWLAHQQSVG